MHVCAFVCVRACMHVHAHTYARMHSISLTSGLMQRPSQLCFCLSLSASTATSNDTDDAEEFGYGCQSHCSRPSFMAAYLHYTHSLHSTGQGPIGASQPTCCFFQNLRHPSTEAVMMKSVGVTCVHQKPQQQTQVSFTVAGNAYT